MKKKLVSLLLLTGLTSGTAQATGLLQGTEFTFNAINHAIISDNVAPAIPSPGDTFILNGYGTLNTPSAFEFSYSYNIAGRFVNFSDGNLYFEHGIEMEGVSNQLTLYADLVRTPFGSSANESSASSYTDSFKVLTMDVLPLPSDLGFFNQTGQGEDQITFKLTDSDKQKFGIIDRDLLLELSTNIISVDFSSGFPQAFNFGAFNNACGPLQNPFDTCSRETGTANLTLTAPTAPKVVHTPIPAAFGLFLSGFGLLSWVRLNRRKTV